MNLLAGIQVLGHYEKEALAEPLGLTAESCDGFECRCVGLMIKAACGFHAMEIPFSFTLLFL